MASRVASPFPAHPPACRRAWLAFAAFALGILLARTLADLTTQTSAWFTPPDALTRPAPWFAGAGLCVALALLARGAWTRALLLLTLFALGTGWWMHRIEHSRSAHAWHAIARSLDTPIEENQGILARLEFRVLTTPETFVDPDPIMTPPFLDGASPRATARVVGGTGIEAHHAKGLTIRVTLPDNRSGNLPDNTAVRAGDRVSALGWLRPPRAPLNPGETDARVWAAQSGELGVFIAGETTPQPETSARGSVSAAWARARSAMRDRALRAVGADDTDAGRLLRAILLGERDPRLDDTRDAFARVGIAHLLAISGLHVGLFALVAVRALRLTGDWGGKETALVGALVLLLLVLVPANPPVIRAGVLTLMLLGASALGRRYDPLTLLAWVALGLLVWRPLDITGLGYQLSVGITALLLFTSAGSAMSAERSLMTALSASMTGSRIPDILRRTARSTRALAILCILCWLASAPLIASHTGVVSPLAWLVTLLVTPLFTLLVALGYAIMLIGLVLPPLAETLHPLTTLLGDWLAFSVRFADDLPAASLTLAPAPAWLGLLGSLLVMLWLAPRVRDWQPPTPHPLASGRAALTAATLALVTLWAWLALTAGHIPTDRVRIDTLAVGDGSCHLVRSGSDSLLWDAGSLRPGLGRRTLPRALHALGVSQIDTAFVTHANIDHYNALSDLFTPFRVRTLGVSQVFLDIAHARPDSAEAELLRRADRAGVDILPVARAHTATLGSATLDLLWPPTDGSFTPARGTTLNDTSLVARVSLGDARLLLTGDIQRAAMAGLSAAEPDLRATALELPHHGSAHPDAYRFVESLNPTIVLQSTGPSRASDPRWNAVRTGHPNRIWITTATDGAAWAELFSDGTVRAGSLRKGEITKRE